MELPSADAVRVVPRAIASPTLNDLEVGELVIDTTLQQIVVRLGNMLFSFAQATATSYLGQADFSQTRNSHWIGVML
jgi:hypothetical protein